jgi:aryl-alcohol dehydrogenase-like predicted oxidoreductase
METLLELKKEGKIRAIGCSNATTAQMDEYRACGQLDTDQELYSMLDREHEEDNLPYAEKHKMAFLGYSTLSQGLLTGKIGPDREFEEGDQRAQKERFSVENRRVIKEMLDKFRPIADSHGVSISQLVIAWTVSQPGCTHTLVGARSPEQAIENAKAGSITLTEDELASMKSIINTSS